MTIQDFTSQLDQLLASFENLRKRSKYPDLSDLQEESARLAARLQAAFDRMTLPGDTYNRAAEALRGRETHIKVVELGFLAFALRDEFSDGWTRKITELVHAETSADLIEMATDLLAANYKDPAVVVAGTALELHLKALATKHGSGVLDTKGRPKKADAIRVDLRQLQITTALEDKRMLYWLGLRNDAAHGNYRNYSAGDAKILIAEVGSFIEKHLA